MTMANPPKRKGIVDPWRVTTPLRPTEKKTPPPGQKINPGEVDFEADIRESGRYIFTGTHGSVEVCKRGLVTADDGLKLLVQCLFEVLEQDEGPDLLEEAGLGIVLNTREFDKPTADIPHASLTGPGIGLYFLRQTYDHGMLRLVRLLRKTNLNILTKWGVTPMLR